VTRRHRHRENKVTKMHAIIGNYEQVLDGIAKIPFVHSVITGTISPNKAEEEELTFQYFTDSGLKLLAKTKEAVQEVFLVTLEKERVLRELRDRGYLKERMRPVSKKNKGGRKPAAGIAGNTPRHDARYSREDMPKEARGATLKDLLNPDMLARLQEQSHQLKEAERTVQEQKRQDEKLRREREQKELDNNFEHLLNTTKLDWKKFK